MAEINPIMHQGTLYIISAPSGAGKTSLIKQLLMDERNIKLSVSYTTRLPRSGEVDGKDYFFVTPESFTKLKAKNIFVETAHVFGHDYGTSSEWLRSQLALGIDIVVEIDWQGAQQLRALFENVSIFVLPPSRAILRARLEARGKDTQSVIEGRMQAAVNEMLHYSEYDYVLINDIIETTVSELKAIVCAQRKTRTYQEQKYILLIEELLKGE